MTTITCPRCGIYLIQVMTEGGPRFFETIARRGLFQVGRSALQLSALIEHTPKVCELQREERASV